MKELIDVAGFFGVDVNVGSTKGGYEEGVPHAETEQRTEESLRELCAYALDRGVSLDIETASFFWTDFMNTCAEAKRMIDRVGCGNLKLMLDTFHLHLEEKNLYEAVAQYAHLCRHVHLADSNRKYPGTGGLDFERIIHILHAGGYDRAYTIEVRPVPSSLVAAREGARSILPILARVYKTS